MIQGLEKFLHLRGMDFDTIGTVFDIGSRDGLQAVELASLFPNATIVAIECNPDTLDRCRRNIAANDRIRLVDKAINDYTGRCAFYPIDPKRTVTTWEDGNPGASSLFLANGAYPIEKYVQTKIEVDCIRLDDLCGQLRIDTIDLIWMDLQGAELLALHSAGSLLEKVRYIYTEVSHRALYEGQCLFTDVESFLTSRGFQRCTQISPERWQQDAIYENTRDLTDVMVPFGTNDSTAVLGLSINSIRRFVQDMRHIYVVAKSDPHIEGVRFVDTQALSFNVDACSSVSNANEEHLLRQLIRLYFPTAHRASLVNVLTVEPGTVFLRPCRFIENGRPVFNFGDTFDPAHFEHMTRLYPSLHRMFAYSGITHTMLHRRAWLEELHRGVEEARDGAPFWRSYLQAIDAGQEGDGASDCEIYFNYCLLFHANDLIIRRFRWRNVETLEELKSDDLDYIVLGPTLRANPDALKLLDERIERRRDLSAHTKTMSSPGLPARRWRASKFLLEKLLSRVRGLN